MEDSQHISIESKCWSLLGGILNLPVLSVTGIPLLESVANVNPGSETSKKQLAFVLGSHQNVACHVNEFGKDW